MGTNGPTGLTLWIARATTFFTDAGIAEAEARQLGMVLIELLEGGFLLSRAARNTEALEAAGAVATAVVRASLPVDHPARLP